MSKTIDICDNVVEKNVEKHIEKHIEKSIDGHIEMCNNYIINTKISGVRELKGQKKVSASFIYWKP